MTASPHIWCRPGISSPSSGKWPCTRPTNGARPIPSYLDITTPATLGYIRYATKSRITQKYPRHKLASDGTRYSPGQAIVTPSVIRGELLALYRELEYAGIVENFDAYKADLIVERNGSDRNRVDVLAPPDIVNQFRIFAMQNMFVL